MECSNRRVNSQGLDYPTTMEVFDRVKMGKRILKVATAHNQKVVEEGPALEKCTLLSSIVECKEVLDVFLPFASGVLKAAMDLEVGCDTN